MATPLASPRLGTEAAPLFDEDLNLEDDPLSFPIAALPPFPKAQHTVLRKQVINGMAVVGTAIASAVACVHGLAWYAGDGHGDLWSLLILATNAQAAFAVVMHINVVFMDPGVLARDRGSSLPVPPVVAERLRAGDSLDGLDNIRDDSDGSSYCVRCCVWRRPPPTMDAPERAPSEWSEWLWRKHPDVARCWPCAGRKYTHHCSICQRCVVDHDHHCGVLGKCIGLRNMPYFMALLVVAQTGGFSVLLAGLLAIYQRHGKTTALYALAVLGVWFMVNALCVAVLNARSSLSAFFRHRSASQRAVHAPIAPAMPVSADEAKDLPRAVAVAIS